MGVGEKEKCHFFGYLSKCNCLQIERRKHKLDNIIVTSVKENVNSYTM